MNDHLDLDQTLRGFRAGQKVFGRYTLQKILGRGGMGIVWLAHDEELEEELALKFLPEVVVADKSALDDLRRETRRSRELTHPHIVRIHDFIRDETTAAIAMEYVPGDTLSHVRLEQPDQVFNPAQLLPWVKQLGTALDYAHDKAKVVHRDLKPANLMLDKAGELKVTDFGIARSISDSVSRVSHHAATGGTPYYMSPQQMMGEEPAPSDDLYSLGATLFELLTGKPPFYTGNLLLQVQSKEAPRLNERRHLAGLPPLPEAWETTLAALLAKDPAARPARAGEVVAVLAGAAPLSSLRRAVRAMPAPSAGWSAQTESPPAPAPTAARAQARATGAVAGFLGHIKENRKSPYAQVLAIVLWVFMMLIHRDYSLWESYNTNVVDGFLALLAYIIAIVLPPLPPEFKRLSRQSISAVVGIGVTMALFFSVHFKLESAPVEAETLRTIHVLNAVNGMVAWLGVRGLLNLYAKLRVFFGASER